MIISEVPADDYASTVTTPFSCFDTVNFCALNASKVDTIKHLIFSDEKKRFGLIAGIKDGTLKAPFSSPYSCFSQISKNNKVSAYTEATTELINYARSQKLSSIRLILPPTFYNEPHIAALTNGLHNLGFKATQCDLNFQYKLSHYDDNYEMNIDPKARQKLRAATRNNLIFEKTKDSATAYEIIRANRAAKGYPLWMTHNDVLRTHAAIDIDFFLIRAPDTTPIASSIVYHVTPDIVQVIYWGNTPDTDDLKPMNFLAQKSFEHYKGMNKSFFDIGPSTDQSIPNFGLCDFKQSIGCDVSTKLTYEFDVRHG